MRGGKRGGRRRRPGTSRRGRRRGNHHPQSDHSNAPLLDGKNPIDLNVEEDYLIEGESDDESMGDDSASDTSSDSSFDPNERKLSASGTTTPTASSSRSKSHKGGKQQYYEQHKHRFEMNNEVLTWVLDDIMTPIELDPIPDKFRDVKHYCNSFLDYVFEETRACIQQSIETDNHGEFAKCAVTKWKKGKNRGDSATIYFDIIPRPPKDPNMTPYIPMFQKHDYCIVTTEPNLKDLEKQNHFFVIVEEGNQQSTNKFKSQSQPWNRRGRRGGRRGGRGGRQNSLPRANTSNIQTKFKAKFVATSVTKHMLNMEATFKKGRKHKGGHRQSGGGGKQNWFVFPIFTMVTKHREYEALQRMTIPNDIFQVIKGDRAHGHQKAQPVENIAPPLKEFLEKAYNTSQFKAIQQVLNRVDQKVHLIHGPPGCGKTSVLLGLIMALLANKKRILICSGTNVAVDHIINKMTQNGLRNSNGEKYQLSINKMARIGNDEKIDELSKKIDPATRFKQLQRNVKDIIHCVELIRNEQGEVMEKSRQSNTAFNARNSIKSRTEKINKLISNTDDTINRLLTTKLVNQEMVNTVLEKFSKVKEHIKSFLDLGNSSEAKKQDLNNNAKDLYDEIDAFFKELQVYLTLDNRDVEKKILDNCDLVFATLAITGRHVMRSCKTFDVLIIDEAAQVTESESIIPLCLVTETLVLIGDPKQLPSTVLSEEAVEKEYNRSMFERLMKLSHNKGMSIQKPVLLDTQYRMHPAISKFPENVFYHGILKDGENVKQYHAHPDWKPLYENGLESCLFMHCPKSVESFNAHIKSYQNEEEANMVVKLIDFYMTTLGISRSKIAVITFYRAQVDLIREKLSQYEKEHPQVSKSQVTSQKEAQTSTTAPQNQPSQTENAATTEVNKEPQVGTSDDGLGEPLPEDYEDSSDEEEPLEEIEEWFDVNTVDSYQGSEKQIVILSTVRANDRNSLGFCVDQRRLNVAITRAQYSLVVVGNGENLCSNDIWRSFISNTKIVEPSDYFKTETGESIATDNLLARNIQRNSLNLVAALLSNKSLLNSIENMQDFANKIIEMCLNHDNHVLFGQAIKQLKINLHTTGYRNGNNLIHRCIHTKSYDCLAVLLHHVSSHSLLLDFDDRGQLAIHLIAIDYGRKQHEKEKLKEIFEVMVSAMTKIEPSAQQKKQLHLMRVDPLVVFETLNRNGQSVAEILIKKGCEDLLEILAKYHVLNDTDENLRKLAKGGNLERFFKNNNATSQVPPSSNSTQQPTKERPSSRQHQQQHHLSATNQTRNPQQKSQGVTTNKDQNLPHKTTAVASNSQQDQHRTNKHQQQIPTKSYTPKPQEQKQQQQTTSETPSIDYQKQYEQFKQLMQAKFTPTAAASSTGSSTVNSQQEPQNSISSDTTTTRNDRARNHGGQNKQQLFVKVEKSPQQNQAPPPTTQESQQDQ
ncbi:hypothetical protein C9374_002387 [Naegleria lovaniensis]|uniref:AAA+ ATPase domain-containing protein n=1 Tax=Naegleria lovaniensis TaxID=51637 RepID=A0AA88GUP1_NAELO|nr:uncharacterized protein C9374_002387 [Naegleria lovaniensis]KAG2386643.1 hypothetical protein C9374_002387 [Naegleria lovaniensis]